MERGEAVFYDRGVEPRHTVAISRRASLSHRVITIHRVRGYA